MDLSITNSIVSSKIYNKLDDFNFGIVNFPFLDGDVPRPPSYGAYILQLIRFARVCFNVNDISNRKLLDKKIITNSRLNNSLIWTYACNQRKLYAFMPKIKGNPQFLTDKLLNQGYRTIIFV